MKKIRLWLLEVANLPRAQQFLVLFFSLVFYLSCGFEEKTNFYQASIQPDPTSTGTVKVVFYDPHFDEYVRSGLLRIPETGWTATRASDSVTLTAAFGAASINIQSREQPVEAGLVHYPDGGIVKITAPFGPPKVITLKSSSELISKIILGGADSVVSSSGIGKRYPLYFRLIIFSLIVSVLILISMAQERTTFHPINKASLSNFLTIIFFSAPLFLSTSIVLLSFWPGNVAYDGSLQWFQAISRTGIDEPLGVTSTLFLRLFSYLSKSPSIVILVQSALSAVSIGFILWELCYLGVSRRVALFTAIVIALTPQYAFFFTTVGKDALSAIGLMFLTYSILKCCRNLKEGKSCLLSVVQMICAAAFSGLMRVNILPVVLVFVLIFSLFLFLKQRKIVSLSAVFTFLLLIIFIPKISVHFASDTSTLPKGAKTSAAIVSQDKGFPLGLFGNFYIYHLFSAAESSGVFIDKKNEDLFLKIAPKNAWLKYSCEMADTTFTSISEGILFGQSDYVYFLKKHQIDLAWSVIDIIRKNPKILVNRQLCITRMLWHIGYGQKPFQTTVTMGYDSVTDDFKKLAGENRSKLPIEIKNFIQRYVYWSERHANFWLFWKPALFLYVGLFCVISRLIYKRDAGIAFALAVPILVYAVLFLVIPFPAYRYTYPAILIMMLLSTVAFSRSGIPSGRASNLVASTRERLFWVDACRSIAIVGVVIIHSSGTLFYKYKIITNFDWLLVNFWDSLSRVAVPLFIMLSGSLLLHPNENVSIKDHKILYRVLKVLVPLLSWSLFYLWWIDFNTPVNTLTHDAWLSPLLLKPVVYHLSFVFIIIGLYIISPLLQILYVACKTNPRLKSYFFILWIVTHSLVIFYPMKWIDSLQIMPLFGFGAYFVLGALLSNSRLVAISFSKWVGVYLSASVATFLITWWYSYSYDTPSEIAYSYFSVNVFIASIGAFMFIRKLKSPNSIVTKMVEQLSKASFFIYFIHVLILEFFEYHNFGVKDKLLGMHLGIDAPVTALIVLLFSFSISWLFSLIPSSRRIFG